MAYSQEYLTAFIEKAKELMPAWMVERIHLAARPASGGRARRRQATIDNTTAETVTMAELELEELAKAFGAGVLLDPNELAGGGMDPGDGYIPSEEPDDDPQGTDDDPYLDDDPTDEDLDRMTQTEAGDVILRALWREYMATHFPPGWDGDDFDGDGYPMDLETSSGTVGATQGAGDDDPSWVTTVTMAEEALKAFDASKHPRGAGGEFGTGSSFKLGDHVSFQGKVWKVVGVNANGTLTLHRGGKHGGEVSAHSKDCTPHQVKHRSGATHHHHGQGAHGKPAHHHRRKVEWEVPLWKAEAEAQQIVYGVVLVPELADSQGDVVSAEEIEQAAHDFLVQYRESGLQHIGDTLPSIQVIESYIAPVDMEIAGRQVPMGSWVMAVKINDPEIWQMVLDGRLTGFSIQGWAIPEELEAA